MIDATVGLARYGLHEVVLKEFPDWPGAKKVFFAPGTNLDSVIAWAHDEQ